MADDPAYDRKRAGLQIFFKQCPNQCQAKPFRLVKRIRWAIEQCFEETKSELGMDDYEVRKYTGWHHHMLASILAHFFLWHLKLRLGKKNTIYYFIAA